MKYYLNRKQIMLFFFAWWTTLTFSQDYNFLNFNIQDGMAQSYVYSIIQDNKGFLWVSTGNGLSRYDGFTFKNFSTVDFLADNFITSSIQDGKNLWFGHMNGGLTYYDGTRFFPFTDYKLNQSPITQFGKSADGLVWASTYADGLLRLQNGSGVTGHYSFKDKKCIVSFYFLNDREILIGTNSGLLIGRLKDPEEIEMVKTISEIPESKITSIIKMTKGAGYYVATENDGIYECYPENGGMRISKILMDQVFESSGIQNICEDNFSDLWVGTFGHGLIKLAFSKNRGTRIDYFKKASGFADDNIKYIYQDREGNMWSGNFGEGLTRITPKTFSVTEFDDPVSGREVFSVDYGSKINLIGTDKGLIKMDPLTGKILKFYGRSFGLPRDSITSVYAPEGGDVWIGTDKNGIYKLDVKRDVILKYPAGNGSLENSITSITGTKEQVWIGTKKGLCRIIIKTGDIKWYTINQGGLPHNYINCLYADKYGRLWLSTHSNIITYIKDDKVFKIPLNSNVGILTLGPITEDLKGRIWVGSSGNGVYLIDSDTITNLTTKEGLLSDFCYSLICDENANIWVGHKGGLSKIRTEDLKVKPVRYFRTTSDNYGFNFNAVSKDKNGIIHFGTDHGLVSYNYAIENIHYVPPVAGITSIMINNEEHAVTDRIVLPHGIYKIRIDFLGICLKEPALVSYQYKLDGYDPMPEITKTTYVTYNRLSDGEYKFILHAVNGDGISTDDPLILQIIIKMPVWKEWWFYPALAILLASLIFSYIKRKEYKFETERKLLEEKVLKRTQEIQCQKNEIELQRDLIDKKNASIMASITYASHIQNAVMSPQELVCKLLPDNFILNKPKDIVSGDFYWLTKKDNKVIFVLADCTGHGVPGAFMSLLGITLLNEIVNMEGVTKSNDIVRMLRNKVVRSLQQNRKEIITSDGLDISVCVMDRRAKLIQYTGAMNDMVFIHDGKLEVVEADHLSVSVLFEDSGPFTSREFNYTKGDLVYLFSDGYQDQFGGSRDRKYLSRRLHDSLLEIHKLPMEDQKMILEERFNGWKQDKVQTDDVLIMGIRL